MSLTRMEASTHPKTRWLLFIEISLMLLVVLSIGQVVSDIQKSKLNLVPAGILLAVCSLFALVGLRKKRYWARLLSALLLFYWSISRIFLAITGINRGFAHFVIRDKDPLEITIIAILICVVLFVLCEAIWLLFSDKAKAIFAKNP